MMQSDSDEPVQSESPAVEAPEPAAAAPASQSEPTDTFSAQQLQFIFDHVYANRNQQFIEANSVSTVNGTSLLSARSRSAGTPLSSDLTRSMSATGPSELVVFLQQHFPVQDVMQSVQVDTGSWVQEPAR